MEREQERQRFAGHLRNLIRNADVIVDSGGNANILCGRAAFDSWVLMCIYATNFYLPFIYFTYILLFEWEIKIRSFPQGKNSHPNIVSWPHLPAYTRTSSMAQRSKGNVCRLGVEMSWNMKGIFSYSESCTRISWWLPTTFLIWISN